MCVSPFWRARTRFCALFGLVLAVFLCLLYSRDRDTRTPRRTSAAATATSTAIQDDEHEAGPRGGHGHHNRYVTTCNAAQVQNDSRMSQLTDGAMIEIHLAFRFPQDIWVAMTQADRDYVITACHQHWASRTAQQVTIEILTDAMSQIRQLTNNTTPNQVRTNTPQSVAQVTTNTNNTITLHGIMGRRNSQNNKRACHS